jgi:hypothetical protein
VLAARRTNGSHVQIFRSNNGCEVTDLRGYNGRQQTKRDCAGTITGYDTFRDGDCDDK